MKSREWAQKALGSLSKYKYVLLVALVGIILLVWPTGDGEKKTVQPAGEEGSFPQAEALEERLAKALSQIDGAGEVTVVLTLDAGPRRVLAQDGKATQAADKSDRETETVVVSAGSGSQQPVELQTIGPTYRGALVVASGGDDPQVRLALTQAVSALTGLGSDKISISKGK